MPWVGREGLEKSNCAWQRELGKMWFSYIQTCEKSITWIDNISIKCKTSKHLTNLLRTFRTFRKHIWQHWLCENALNFDPWCTIFWPQAALNFDPQEHLNLTPRAYFQNWKKHKLHLKRILEFLKEAIDLKIFLRFDGKK